MLGHHNELSLLQVGKAFGSSNDRHTGAVDRRELLILLENDSVVMVPHIFLIMRVEWRGNTSEFSSKIHGNEISRGKGFMATGSLLKFLSYRLYLGILIPFLHSRVSDA